jgi:hypothetical protein
VIADLARATAFFLTVTQLGGAVGGATAGAIWSSTLPGRLRAYLPAETQGEIDSIIGSLAVALSFQPGTPTRAGIERAYTEVQHILNLVALVALVPALICMLAMQDVKLLDEPNPEGIVHLATALPAGACVRPFDTEGTLTSARRRCVRRLARERGQHPPPALTSLLGSTVHALYHLALHRQVCHAAAPCGTSRYREATYHRGSIIIEVS